MEANKKQKDEKTNKKTKRQTNKNILISSKSLQIKI